MTQSLVSEARYREVTGDYDTAQYQVVAKLNDAVRAIEGQLGRGLEAIERTEITLEYGCTIAYRCTPVITVASIEPIDQWDPWRYAGFLPPHRHRRVTVTYTGGWTASTLPSPLETAIIRVARTLASAVPLPDPVLSGATNKTVGDVTVSYARGTTPQTDTLPEGVWPTIAAYRYRSLGAV